MSTTIFILFALLAGAIFHLFNMIDQLTLQLSDLDRRLHRLENQQ
ncbi:hypothetical protein [uncultured Parasutterella sp.]|nr:hypothetical protein [uncultured Parasutterella sp.]